MADAGSAVTEEISEQEIQTQEERDTAEATEQAEHEANGNGNGAQQPAVEIQQPEIQRALRLAPAEPSQAMVDEKITRTSVVRRPLKEVDPTYRQTVIKTKENEKTKTHREFLDALMVRIEADDYDIHVNRYLPTHDPKSGQPLPPNPVAKLPVMSYDSLQSEIISAVGGGSFRCVIHEKNGKRVDGQGMQVVLFDISTSQCPPKTEAYDAGSNGIAPAPVQSADEDMLQQKLRLVKEQALLDDAESRASAARQRKNQAMIRELTDQKNLENIQKASVGGGSNEMLTVFQEQTRQILAQMEKDRHAAELARERTETAAKEERRLADERAREERRAADERAKEDRRIADERAKDDRAIMLAAINKITESANKPVPPPPPPDTTVKDIMIPLMAAMQSQQVAQQAQTTEIIKAVATRPPDTSVNHHIEALKSMSEMAIKAGARDSQRDQAFTNSLLTALVQQKDNGNQVTPQLIMEIMKLGKRDLSDAVKMVQDLNGAGGGEEGGITIPEAEYDPRIGFFGNAGRALVSGLRQLPAIAAQNPQMMQLFAPVLNKIFGTAQPNEQQVQDAAARLEQQSTMPPQLQQPQQQQALPNYAMGGSLPPPIAGNPQQPAQFQTKGIRQPGPAPVQRQPAPVQQHAPAPPPIQQSQPTVAQQQRDVATQLEGEMSGIAPADEDHEPTAQERLVNIVTTTMDIATKDIIDNIEKREWPEHAFDYWNGDFKKAIVECPTRELRTQMIQQNCEMSVWLKLVELCSSKQNELFRFYADLERFVNMCQQAMRAQANQQAGISVPPVPPPPSIVTTPPPQQIITQQPAAPTVITQADVPVTAPATDQVTTAQTSSVPSQPA